MNSMRKKSFIIKVSQNAIEKSFLGGNFEWKFSTFYMGNKSIVSSAIWKKKHEFVFQKRSKLHASEERRL